MKFTGNNYDKFTFNFINKPMFPGYSSGPITLKVMFNYYFHFNSSMFTFIRFPSLASLKDFSNILRLASLLTRYSVSSCSSSMVSAIFLSLNNILIDFIKSAVNSLAFKRYVTSIMESISNNYLKGFTMMNFFSKRKHNLLQTAVTFAGIYAIGKLLFNIFLPITEGNDRSSNKKKNSHNIYTNISNNKHDYSFLFKRVIIKYERMNLMTNRAKIMTPITNKFIILSFFSNPSFKNKLMQHVPNTIIKREYTLNNSVSFLIFLSITSLSVMQNYKLLFFKYCFIHYSMRSLAKSSSSFIVKEVVLLPFSTFSIALFNLFMYSLLDSGWFKPKSVEECTIISISRSFLKSDFADLMKSVFNSDTFKRNTVSILCATGVKQNYKILQSQAK